METLREKLARTRDLIEALGAFEHDVRGLAAECDATAAADAPAQQLPGIVRTTMGAVADNVAALAATVNGLRIKSLTAGSASAAYTQMATPEVLEGGYTLIVWSTPSGNEGNTILQTRYGTNYVTQVAFYEAAAGRKCRVRSASKSNGVWNMGPWKEIILPTGFRYNADTRALQYGDAISGQWVNMAVLPENGINTEEVNYLISEWASENIGDWISEWYYNNPYTGEVRPMQAKMESMQQQIDSLQWQLNEKPKITAWLAENGTEQEHIDELMADEQFGRPTFAAVQAMHAKLSAIGYTAQETVECMTDVPDLTDADIAYAKEIYDAWDPATTNINNKWQNDTRLRIFPHIDTINVTSAIQPLLGCTKLQFMPLIDTHNVTSAYFVWANADKPNAVMRRMQPFDWSNCNSRWGLFTGLTKCKIWPKRIDMSASAYLSNMFLYCDSLTSDNCPEVVFDKTRVVDMAQMFTRTSLKHLPITDFGVATKVTGMYSQNKADMGDLGGVTLKWDTEDEVDLNGIFGMGSNSIGPTGSLPQIAVGTNVGSMNSFNIATHAKIAPDYSHLKPTDVSYAFESWQSNGTLLRIEGLNFERVTECKILFTYASGRSHPNLRYIRILNLGMGPCTYYDFRGPINWGDGSAENLQSLIDSLLTNSYDRTAAGMAAAQLVLPKQVWARLTTEQQAEVTAKGFTVTLSNY